MPLRLNLKPGERIIVGGAVLRNGDARADFLIENEVPVLRQADILSPRDVHTACEWIYLAIQLMYVDPDRLSSHGELFHILACHIRDAAPAIAPQLDEVSRLIDDGRLYQALKRAKSLLEREKELIDHAA